MSTWQIILTLIIGAVWVTGFLICLIMFILGWTEDRKLEWKNLLAGVFFPCFALYALCYLLKLYYDIAIREEGIINHIRHIRQVRHEEKEYNRIEKAYKKGEIRREELPKLWCNGITDFELKGELLYDDWHDLVYIENAHNEVLNSFFERHTNIVLKHGCRVIYLPSEIRRLTDTNIVRYWFPATRQCDVELLAIDSTSLLNELYYQEDAQNLHHGFMSCDGWSYKYSAEYLHGRYYPLVEGSDEEILSQIESIAKTIFERHSGGANCTVSRPPLDKEPTDDFADEQYGWEINNLVDEIKERVDKLEQHGISRKLIMKMISEKPKLSRLVVTAELHILLPDYNIEIQMEPINKAVFLLFLRHPEGIIFKHLPDYRKELADIYQMIKPLGLNERAIQSIEDVTNPCLNSINEKCARIRGAFISQFDENLAQHYYIYGRRGEAKKIDLPRDLVIWE